MTPEGKVKALLRKRLKALGCWQYWPVSNGMGMHGIPDCLGCYQGLFFAVETKAPGKRKHKNRGCTGLQVKQLTDIANNKGLSCVLDSEEEINVFIRVLKERSKYFCPPKGKTSSSP